MTSALPLTHCRVLLFVGDIYHVDVVGGRGAGLRVVMVFPPCPVVPVSSNISRSGFILWAFALASSMSGFQPKRRHCRPPRLGPECSNGRFIPAISGSDIRYQVISPTKDIPEVGHQRFAPAEILRPFLVMTEE